MELIPKRIALENSTQTKNIVTQINKKLVMNLSGMKLLSRKEKQWREEISLQYRLVKVNGISSKIVTICR